MATIVTRAGKGSPLTHSEVDANFENLNSDKVETSSVSAFGATLIDDADAATARTTLGLGSAATTDSADYATAAQGSLADSAVQPNDSPTFGSIAVTGTVDGRDVSADGTKLDGIEVGADVTDTANVTAAGALMDSELTNITAVKALDQGVATTDSPAFAGLTVDTNTLYVDSTNNRVGIGTSSPAEALEVVGDIQIGSGSDFGVLHLGDTPDQTKIIGRGPSHSSLPNTFEVQTNGSSRLFIGSVGQLGIGGANYGTSGQVLTSNGTGSAPSWADSSVALGPLLQLDEITSSQTYTATRTSKALLVAIGAGGRGGYYTGTNDTVAASGGGSGALCAKMVDIAIGETLSITIGADNTNQGLANFSGDTTITGTLAFGSVSLNGGGGQCGMSSSGSSGLRTATGASGGSATGGDLNIDGMGSGTAERNGSSGEAATSGGSVRFQADHPTATPDVIGTTGSTSGAQVLLPTFLPNMVEMNGGLASTATTSTGTESGLGGGGYGFASTNGSIGGISNNGGNGIAYVVYFGDPSV